MTGVLHVADSTLQPLLYNMPLLITQKCLLIDSQALLSRRQSILAGSIPGYLAIARLAPLTLPALRVEVAAEADAGAGVVFGCEVRIRGWDWGGDVAIARLQIRPYLGRLFIDHGHRGCWQMVTAILGIDDGVVRVAAIW